MTLKQPHRIALATLALTLFPFGLSARAQDKPPTDDQPQPKTADHCLALRSAATETRTFYLANVSNQNDQNEIMNAIRNMLCPGTRVYIMNSQNALIIQAPAEQLALAQKIIADLDRPQKTYRLIYTVTELDAGKAIGTEHYSMVVVPGQHTSMKEGVKNPVVTGSYSDGNATPNGVQTQFTYLDIGMNFDASIIQLGNGVSLKSKVEQSSLGQSSLIAGIQEPVVNQTVVEGTSFLTLDKPVMLGSIDVPNTTRHIDIAVALEAVK